MLTLIWKSGAALSKRQHLSLILEEERVFSMESWHKRPLNAFPVEGGHKYKARESGESDGSGMAQSVGQESGLCGRME